MIEDHGYCVSIVFKENGSSFFEVSLFNDLSTKVAATFIIDPTRGQLRAACRLLGLELEEVSA